MTSRAELRKRYLPAAKTPTPVEVENEPEVERAFVLHAESGRTIITAPVRETAAVNKGFLYLNGRFVEADTPNRNGAMWTSDDLELAQGTVAGGPLNWLHNETHIIGTLLDGSFVSREAAEKAGATGVGNHITSTAAVWRFLFPREAELIQKASQDAQLYYSMECVSREVMCLDSPGNPGCGETFEYADFLGKRACAHLNQRSSARRFVDPIFLGGAIIVPPVQPGWARADVEVLRQAAEYAEEHSLEGALSRPQAEALVERVLLWANR